MCIEFICSNCSIFYFLCFYQLFEYDIFYLQEKYSSINNFLYSRADIANVKYVRFTCSKWLNICIINNEKVLLICKVKKYTEMVLYLYMPFSTVLTVLSLLLTFHSISFEFGINHSLISFYASIFCTYNRQTPIVRPQASDVNIHFFFHNKSVSLYRGYSINLLLLKECITMCLWVRHGFLKNY